MTAFLIAIGVLNDDGEDTGDTDGPYISRAGSVTNSTRGEATTAGSGGGRNA
jgi:hypothetical protein